MTRRRDALEQQLGRERSVSAQMRSRELLKEIDDTKRMTAKDAAPATTNPIVSPRAVDSIAVDMVSEDGVLKVPIQINGAISLKFVVDSGATFVQIPKEVFLTLVRADTIKEGDYLPGATLILADGRTVKSDKFILRSIKVGETTFTDVEASIGGVNAELLLGQSFLKKFGEWKIDNKKAKLILTK